MIPAYRVIPKRDAFKHIKFMYFFTSTSRSLTIFLRIALYHAYALIALIPETSSFTILSRISVDLEAVILSLTNRPIVPYSNI